MKRFGIIAVFGIVLAVVLTGVIVHDRRQREEKFARLLRTDPCEPMAVGFSASENSRQILECLRDVRKRCGAD